MPILYRGVLLSPKLPYHRNVSLGVYFPIIYMYKILMLLLVIIYINKPLFYHSPQCYHCLFVDLLVKKKNALGPGFRKQVKNLNSPASLHEQNNSGLNMAQLLLDKHTIHKEVELRPRKR